MKLNKGNIATDAAAVWKETGWTFGLLLMLVGLLGFIFYDGLLAMFQSWEREEYSHGYLIPLVVIFLIWQKKDHLERIPFSGSWTGGVIVLGGIILFFLGDLSTINIIIKYAFLLTLFGIVLAFLGWRGIKCIWVPLVYLFFMIPLPVFFYNDLSASLQLISSQLGVAVIQFFGISVYLEGNVIDLGSYQLQVVEACSGLRYLFPLMSIAFLCAYFFKGAFWKRTIIFLSSIPLTVMMNSFRIGVIGVLVEYKGIAMADGFLHYFEGWVVFMSCLGIIFVEMWLLSKIGQDNDRPLRDVFGLDFPAPTPQNADIHFRSVPVPLLFVTSILFATAVAVAVLPERKNLIPQRADFERFPAVVGEWRGSEQSMEQKYLNILKLDDYLISDFSNPSGASLNLYVAYYNSQISNDSGHSPRSCLPGDGWEIKDMRIKVIQNLTTGDDAPLVVNRVEIEKNEQKQLVYYWFQQRGRVITNEYMVKWYLFWDALTKNRTDGALVRVSMIIKPGENSEDADNKLAAFIKMAVPHLHTYIPG